MAPYLGWICQSSLPYPFLSSLSHAGSEFVKPRTMNKVGSFSNRRQKNRLSGGSWVRKMELATCGLSTVSIASLRCWLWFLSWMHARKKNASNVRVPGYGGKGLESYLFLWTADWSRSGENIWRMNTLMTVNKKVTAAMSCPIANWC